MNVQTFNSNLVETSNKLIDFTEYSNEIIKSVFVKNEIFKFLHENSEKKGFSISSTFLETFCNIKISSSKSLLRLGLLLKKDYIRKSGYFLTFTAFEKCIKKHCKKYQEHIQEIKDNYDKYCELFNQPSDSDEDSSESDSDSDEDSSDSNSESEEDSSDSDSESEEEEEQLIISCPDNIKTYNKQLIDDKKNPSIVEYVKALNEKFYHIDISFIDDFLKLVGTDECVIPHMMLEKYGVLKIKDSAQVARKLKDYNLIENMHYKRVSCKLAGNPSKGGRPAKKYRLSPDAFKICLMRSLNTMIYAKYFCLLEKCVKFFNDLHLERNLIYRVSMKKLVKQKDKTIKKKNCKIDELKEIIIDVRESQKRTEKIMLEISKDLKTVISKVSEFKVPRGKQKDLQEVIGICKEPNTNNGYETYHVVRCQSKYYDTRIKEKREKYDARDLFRIDTNNSTLCWHSMKQYFSKNNRFVTDTYSFKYRGRIDEDGLKELLKDSVKTIKSQVSGR